MKKIAGLMMLVFVALMLSMGLATCVAAFQPEIVSECVAVTVVDHRIGRRSDYFLVEMPNKKILRAAAEPTYPITFRGSAIAARWVGRWMHGERLMLMEKDRCIGMLTPSQ